MTFGPRRRSTDNHVHPEYWSESDHNRFEDRIAAELVKMRAEMHEFGNKVAGQTNRLSWLMGALAVIVFVVNILVTVYLRNAVAP